MPLNLNLNCNIAKLVHFWEDIWLSLKPSKRKIKKRIKEKNSRFQQSQKRSLPKTRPKKKPAIDFFWKVYKSLSTRQKLWKIKTSNTIAAIPVSVWNCPRDGAWLGTLAGGGDSWADRQGGCHLRGEEMNLWQTTHVQRHPPKQTLLYPKPPYLYYCIS